MCYPHTLKRGNIEKDIGEIKTENATNKEMSERQKQKALSITKRCSEEITLMMVVQRDLDSLNKKKNECQSLINRKNALESLN